MSPDGCGQGISLTAVDSALPGVVAGSSPRAGQWGAVGAGLDAAITPGNVAPAGLRAAAASTDEAASGVGQVEGPDAFAKLRRC